MGIEDIAIIGMSGRFPGAKNIDQLWENLCLEKESLTKLTDDELRANGVSEELLQNPSYIKSGFFLDQVDFFDADFFDIPPREAVAMDPQHRFFLECAWEALEDGGYIPGTEPLDVGVFAGSGPLTASYLLEYIKAHPEIQGTSANYHTYGTDKDFFSTRASYKLNLKGPSLNIQTACSTSLVAVHLACEAIKHNHCSLALAGGMSIRIPHRKGYLHTEGDIYSHDGRCRTFDAHSSGTVFGNGIGLVLLKSLPKAIQDKDRIYAVIKGSFINNDGGSKPSFPAPGCEGQTACITQGLSLFDIDPETIQFIETHGTGTVVGDPIEMKSLAKAFEKVSKESCAIGSIKPNIGHLGGASGVTSLIKMALALFHKKMPAHINFTKPNPLINFPNTPFYVNTKTKEWPAKKTPRRGAINSFGVGGTNAFAVLEEPPQIKNHRSLEIMPRTPFTLSAKTREALDSKIFQLIKYLTDHPNIALCDVAYTLNCGKKHFSHRLFFEASTYEECLAILKERTFTLNDSRGFASDLHNFVVSSGAAKNINEWPQLLERLKNHYLAGNSINWKDLHALFQGEKISLPTYPFQGKSYWVQVPSPSSYLPLIIHPLLGWKLDTSLVSDELLYENILRLNDLHYLKDHKIFNRTLFPFTGFLEIFCAAASAVGFSLPLQLTGIEIKYALELSPQTRIQTKIKKIEDCFHMSIYSHDRNGWRLHASAVAQSLDKKNDPTKFDPSWNQTQNTTDFYTIVAEKGYQYGSHFKTFQDFSLLPDQTIIGHFKTEAPANAYTIYPPLLDGVFQLNLLARIKSNHQDPDGTLSLPISIQEVQIFEPLSNQIHACIDISKTKEDYLSDFSVYNPSGQLIMKLEKIEKKLADKDSFLSLLDRNKINHDFAYHELWEISKIPQSQPLFSNSQQNRWLLISSCSNTPLLKKIKEELSRRGEECIEIIFNSTSSLCQNAEIENIQGLINFLPYENQKEAFQSTVALFQTYLTTFTQTSTPCFTLTKGLYSQYQLATLIGLQRSLKLEFPDKPLIHIDIAQDLNELEAIERLVNEFMSPDFEPEISLREDERFVNRIVTHKEYIKRNQHLDIPSTAHYFLEKGARIEELSFKDKEKQSLQDHEIDVAIQAVSLNFRDILNASGLYPGESGPLGSDFCGKIMGKGRGVLHLEVGQTVFGIASGAFQNRLITSSSFVVPKPKELGVDDSAAIPIVFLTTYYALIKLAHLQKHDKVLIHCATGGIGLAAIQIAKQVGAEIFATVSCPRKKAYLQSLGIRCIYSSRSLNFVEELKNSKITVVLNSLTGDGFIEGALRLCAPNACFLELSKRNIWTKEQVALARPDIRYFIVAIDELRQKKPEEIHHLLQEITLFFEKKQWTPLPHTTFSLNQIKPAFQYLQQAKQIGKVVVKFPNPWRDSLSQGTYLITGGLGGLGMVTAEWLIEQGVKHLVLIGRTIPQTIHSKLNKHRKNGVEILVKACDVTNEDQLSVLFKELKHGRQIKGIVHAAGIVYNTGFLQHSWQDFERILAPKITGSLLLHNEIIKQQLDLDFILYFSSIAALLGGHGRTSYAAANSFLDSFALHQQQMGIPAISINWGVWAETGMALPHLKQMEARGQYGMTNEDALRYLEMALNAQSSNLAVHDVNWDRYIEVMASKNPRLSLLANDSTALPNPSIPLPKNSKTIMQKLVEVSAGDGAVLLQDYLITAMRKILGEQNDYLIKIEESFIKQKFDSLNQIEFLVEIERDLQLKQPLRAHTLQKYPTVASLAKYLCTQLSNASSQNLLSAIPKTQEEAPTFPHLPLNKQQWSPLPENMKYFWDINFSRDFNIGYVVRFHKFVNVELLQHIFNYVLRQHPIFYLFISSFSPRYKVSPFKKMELYFMDLSQEKEIENKLNSEHKKSIDRPFDQQEFPKLRGLLYKMSESEYELQIICPHSIADGRVLHLFFKAIDDAYTHLIEGRSLPPYSPAKDFLVQYPKHDALLMQDIERKSNIIKDYYKNYKQYNLKSKTEYKKNLSCAPIFLKCSMDDRRKFQTTCQEMGIEQSLALNGLAALALSLITEQTEFSVGSSSNGMFSSDFNQTIGPFAKRLPLNIHRNSDDTLQDYMDRLKESQILWSYLREFPSFLLKSPRSSSKPMIRLLEKIIEWNWLPAITIPFIRSKKDALTNFLGKKKFKNSSLRLIINELELKDFSNFSAYNRSTLLDRNEGASDSVRVLSILVNQEWVLYLSWLKDSQNQKLMLQLTKSLIDYFLSNRNVYLKDFNKEQNSFFMLSEENL